MLDKKEELKDKVLALVLDTFNNSGYKSINMDIIARSLSVSKRTLYELFPSKDEMIVESILVKISQFQEDLDEIAKKIIRNDMTTFFDNLFEVLKLATMHTTLFSENFTNELRLHLPKFYQSCRSYDRKRYENFRNVIELGKSKGYFKTEFDTDIIFMTLHYSLSYILRNEHLLNISLKVEDAIKQVLKIIFTGAMTPEFKQEFKQKLTKEIIN
ncbi:MAG TPA: TetR/AcrR family transcriptional regulator [Candidatus Kapabacteria bacterium]|nr:TetR/AcrR family transcriptional regulator [Candidatus Kapabacteria bacterium]